MEKNLAQLNDAFFLLLLFLNGGQKSSPLVSTDKHQGVTKDYQKAA